jgi:hypothetical protein
VPCNAFGRSAVLEAIGHHRRTVTSERPVIPGICP